MTKMIGNFVVVGHYEFLDRLEKSNTDPDLVRCANKVLTAKIFTPIHTKSYLLHVASKGPGDEPSIECIAAPLPDKHEAFSIAYTIKNHIVSPVSIEPTPREVIKKA